MAISVGTVASQKFTTSGRTTDTLSCTQPTGSNGYLLVLVWIDSSSSAPTSVTYNGVSLTQVDTPRTFAGANQIVSAWVLAGPSTGANNVVVTYGAAMYNPTVVVAYPMTGVSGVGSFGFTAVAASPQTNAITVSENSIIVATCGATGSGGSLTITIDGSLRTLDYSTTIYNYIMGARTAALSSGSRTTSATSDGQVGVYNIEVQAFSLTSKNTQAVFL